MPDMIASQRQDYMTGNGDASVYTGGNVSPSGMEINDTASGEVTDNNESLNAGLPIWSPLNKSKSYVNNVLDSTSVYTVVPPIPTSEDGSQASLRKSSSADEILPLLPVPNSFCARYLDTVPKESSSRDEKTPMASPALSRSSSGVMTPPVGDIYPLAYRPLITTSGSDEAAAGSGLINKESERYEEVKEKLVTVTAVTEGLSMTNDLEENPEALRDVETMETEDTTNSDNAADDKGETSMEISNADCNPPPPVLFPARSPTSSGKHVDHRHPPQDGPAPVQIVFSFDTTGSMSQCIDEVRTQLLELIQRLLGDVPFLQVAVIAHGDYCDASEFYTIKSVDFTNDVNTLTQFLNDVSGTGGGDWEECYELVLNYARTLNWTPGTQRSLVMIGDAVPHEKDYYLNVMKLDWRQEADILLQELVS